jgi:phosphoribosylformimino-5-aminoimidazole carboxamide ribotide isomerase
MKEKNKKAGGILRLYPAIDLQAGQVVRLKQGKFEERTLYADDPSEVAKGFAAAGARYLHVVDLDGALQGEAVNGAAIRAIVRMTELRVQVGGGIRTLERMAELLASGVDRLILGTAAVRDPELFREALRRFGAERIVCGIDVKKGRVAVAGWLEETDLPEHEFGRQVKAAGAVTALYTDIARDGMLTGPNLAAAQAFGQKTGLNVLISGGVSDLSDLAAIRQARDCGAPFAGVIVGKALYTGAFTLAEALPLIENSAAEV